MFTQVGSFFFSKVLEYVSKEMENALFGEIEPQLEILKSRLNLVEERVDRIQLLHLDAALHQLQKRDHQNAVREFEYAIRADDLSAVSRFWLSVTLKLLNRDDDAGTQLKTALSLNPFVIPPSSLPNGGFEFPTLLPQHPLRSWVCELSHESNWYVIPRRKSLLGRFWNGVEKLKGDRSLVTQIKQASFSGDDPIVRWEAFWEAGSMQSQLLSRVDFETGKLVWTVPVDHREVLFFATPRFAITLAREPNPVFYLRETTTGAVRQRMSQHYFESAFFPHHEDASDRRAFALSNYWSFHKEPETSIPPERARYSELYRGTISDVFDPTNMVEIRTYNGIGTSTGPHGGDSAWLTGQAEIRRL